MTTTFIGNIILRGKLECLTGLHIGGSKEKMEIGGVDSPVIRDPNTSFPYIPGSSLKGRMRALLAYALDKADQDPNPKSFDPTCPLQRIFGSSHDDRNIGPTRLIVRDSYPDTATVDMWRQLDSELLYTEFKPENSVDRLTSKANPRFLERVVKGSVFDVEMVFGVYDGGDVPYFSRVLEALRLLEHSALGKNVSRGYGQVAFKFATPLVLLAEDYRRGSQLFQDASKPSNHEFWKEKIQHRLSDFDEVYLQQLLSPLLTAAPVI